MGGSCPARQVFSLWEQLTRADETTIKNSYSSGSAADSSSSGTCTAPVCMLSGYLTVSNTFSLPVPSTRGECQHPLSQMHHEGTEHPTARKSVAKQRNEPLYSLFQDSIQPTGPGFFPTAQFLDSLISGGRVHTGVLGL